MKGATKRLRRQGGAEVGFGANSEAPAQSNPFFAGGGGGGGRSTVQLELTEDDGDGLLDADELALEPAAPPRDTSDGLQALRMAELASTTTLVDGGEDVDGGGGSSRSCMSVRIPADQRFVTFFGGSVGSQLVLYSCLWTMEGDFDSGFLFFALMVCTSGVMMQLGHGSRHLQLTKASERAWGGEDGDRNSPESLMRVTEKIGWHGRMVFFPILMLLMAGLCLNVTGFIAIEVAARDMGSDGGCSDNIIGVIAKMPSRMLALLATAVCGFVLAVVCALRLSREHFKAFVDGHTFIGRLQQQGHVDSDAFVDEREGPSFEQRLFSTKRMRIAFSLSWTCQGALLLLLSSVTGGMESMDAQGAIIFAILVFERLIIGFQLALAWRYFAFSSPVALDDEFQLRERAAWHGGMIFYSCGVGVLQCFSVLPGVFMVMPFFKQASGGGCLGLDLMAKLENAQDGETEVFIAACSLILTTLLGQCWLCRTHFVLFLSMRDALVAPKEE